jgi:hypothetical protein
LKKKQEKKKSGVTRWPGWPGQKLSCNSLIFVFFFVLKRLRFDFFIKNINPKNPVTRSKPGAPIKTRYSGLRSDQSSGRV